MVWESTYNTAFLPEYRQYSLPPRVKTIQLFSQSTDNTAFRKPTQLRVRPVAVGQPRGSHSPRTPGPHAAARRRQHLLTIVFDLFCCFDNGHIPL